MQHRPIGKRTRSAGSQASENPKEHIARRLEDDPPEPPPGLPVPEEAPAAAAVEEQPAEEVEPENDLLSVE
eukprot:4875661-Pyramimonas_sp.AAC.1